MGAVAKPEAGCAGTVASTHCLCKKPAKAVGEGDRALHTHAVLPGLLRWAVTWGWTG